MGGMVVLSDDMIRFVTKGLNYTMDLIKTVLRVVRLFGLRRELGHDFFDHCVNLFCYLLGAGVLLERRGADPAPE